MFLQGAPPRYNQTHFNDCLVASLVCGLSTECGLEQSLNHQRGVPGPLAKLTVGALGAPGLPSLFWPSYRSHFPAFPSWAVNKSPVLVLRWGVFRPPNTEEHSHFLGHWFGDSQQCRREACPRDPSSPTGAWPHRHQGPPPGPLTKSDHGRAEAVPFPSGRLGLLSRPGTIRSPLHLYHSQGDLATLKAVSATDSPHAAVTPYLPFEPPPPMAAAGVHPFPACTAPPPLGWPRALPD